MDKRITPPLKWHGGKHYLAPKIVALMPRHTHYVEPFAGGLSVLLAKDPEGVSEVVNDIHKQLMNFWSVLAHEPSFNVFQRKMQAIPFCEEFWELARKRLEQPCQAPGHICIACGLAFFVCCRMSLAGRMESFAPLSKRRTRRGMNEQASAWLTAVEGMPEVHARLKRVAILNRPASQVILQEDTEDTLFYLDPPYLHETRAGTGEYEHEMTLEEHASLLTLLRDIKGKFLLSGYPSRLYQNMAGVAGWKCHSWDLPNNAAAGEEKRRMTECVWTNF
jgi:DNA adenine methylase